MRMAPKTINWTPEKLTAFKKAYDGAKARDADTFIWDGHEFVLGYAFHLIKELERKLTNV